MNYTRSPVRLIQRTAFSTVKLYGVFETFVDMTNCRSTCRTQRCSSGPLMENTSSRPQLRHDCASTTATDSGTIRARWSTRRRSIRQRRSSGRSVQSLLLCFLWAESFCIQIQLSVLILSEFCLLPVSFCNSLSVDLSIWQCPYLLLLVIVYLFIPSTSCDNE